MRRMQPTALTAPSQSRGRIWLAPAVRLGPINSAVQLRQSRYAFRLSGGPRRELDVSKRTVSPLELQVPQRPVTSAKIKREREGGTRENSNNLRVPNHMTLVK